MMNIENNDEKHTRNPNFIMDLHENAIWDNLFEKLWGDKMRIIRVCYVFLRVFKGMFKVVVVQKKVAEGHLLGWRKKRFLNILQLSI